MNYGREYPMSCTAAYPAETATAPRHTREERQRDYLPTLDGWRAIAVVGVMISHLSDDLFHQNGLLPNTLLYQAAKAGAFGVDIFFGLSGLLICSRLLQELQRDGAISLGAFYIRRAFRILPAYFSYLSVIVALALLGRVTISRMEWASCFLFFRNYVPESPASWYVGHFWSLSVEEHFYLIWPAVLLSVGVRRARWGAVALAVAITLWRAIDSRLLLGQQVFGVPIYLRTDTRLDSLVWGCWMAIALNNPNWRAQLRSALPVKIWSPLLIVMTLALVVVQQSVGWDAPLVPLVLAGTLLNPGVAGVFLESKLMRWIGRISYSLYLWQQLFLLPISATHLLGVSQEFPLNVVCVFGCAALSYYVVERPMLRIGRSLAARVAQKSMPISLSAWRSS
jgi:peptidoglycan/LPS O-acetylase OafA/YrhL